jgi:hypothetical protein
LIIEAQNPVVKLRAVFKTAHAQLTTNFCHKRAASECFVLRILLSTSRRPQYEPLPSFQENSAEDLQLPPGEKE